MGSRDSFARPGETEATCIRKVSSHADSSREISKGLYYECQVRGSFCGTSEEYNVKTRVL